MVKQRDFLRGNILYDLTDHRQMYESGVQVKSSVANGGKPEDYFCLQFYFLFPHVQHKLILWRRNWMARWKFTPVRNYYKHWLEFFTDSKITVQCGIRNSQMFFIFPNWKWIQKSYNMVVFGQLNFASLNVLLKVGFVSFLNYITL